MKRLISSTIILVVIAALLCGCGGSVRKEDMIHIILEPQSEAASGAMEEAARIIGDRSKELGGSYITEATDSKIDYWIGKEAVSEDVTEEEYLIHLLLTDGNFKVRMQSLNAEFEKNDFESVSVESDTCLELYNKFSDQLEDKGVSAFDKYYDKLSDDTKVYYLHIKLKDEASGKFEPVMEKASSATGSKTIDALLSEGGGKHVSSDTELGRVLYSQDKNASEMYVLNTYLDNERVTNLAKHILTGDRITTPIVYRVAYNPLYESGEQITGKNQKATISGNAIDMKVSVYSSDKPEENDSTKNVADNLKAELDTLGIDYAIGTYGLGNQNVVARFAPEDVGREFIMLMANRKQIQLSTAMTDFQDTVKGMKLTKDDSGNNCFEVEYTDGYSSPKIGEAAEGETIYLKVNDVTVASVKMPAITTTEKGGTIRFSNMLLINKDSITDENMKVAEFVAKCAEEPAGRISSSLSSAQYCDEQGNKVDEPLNWGYDCDTELAKATINTIESNHSNAEAYMSATSGNTLIIKLDFPVDDKLPEVFMSEVRDIYAEASIGDGAFRDVFITLKKESDNHSMDYCRVIYNKMMYSASSEGMRATLLVSGPTFDKYDDEFVKVIKADEALSAQKWDNIN